MRSRHYDMNGQPMTMEEWAAAFEDTKRRIIGQELVGWGPGKKWVSTVWLGLDHNYYETGPPLIFETMVFVKGWNGLRRQVCYCHDIWMDRYATKEDAAMGHLLAVRKYRYNRRQRRKRLQL